MKALLTLLPIAAIAIAGCSPSPAPQASSDSSDGVPAPTDVAATVAPAGSPSTCRLRTGAALVCSTGDAAALAYDEYGERPTAIPDYRLELLHEMGCYWIAPGARLSGISVVTVGRIPRPNGWRAAWQIVLSAPGRPDDAVIVDPAYLTGNCPRLAPITLTAPLDKPANPPAAVEGPANLNSANDAGSP